MSHGAVMASGDKLAAQASVLHAKVRMAFQ